MTLKFEPQYANLTAISRSLRKNQTLEESVLWDKLRNGRLAGYKFRRQHQVGPYVLDFVCLGKNLVVELDGAEHFTEEGKIADQRRDQALVLLGFTVLRFENLFVRDQLPEVLAKIRASLNALS